MSGVQIELRKVLPIENFNDLTTLAKMEWNGAMMQVYVDSCFIFETYGSKGKIEAGSAAPVF